MSVHSILVPIQSVDDDITAQVTRVLRGTHTSDWGGTIAYKTGLDLLVTLHCRYCCEPPPRNRCWSGVVGELRVPYERADPDRWWRVVERKAAEHKDSHRHVRGLSVRDGWT
jgi:hypothetical protein